MLNRLSLALCLCLAAGQISAQTPQFSTAGVINAASYTQPGVLAPGVSFAIFGTSLSNGTAAAVASPLPTGLAGVRVLVNGVPTPLFYVSQGLINAQFPLELTGIATASVQVEVDYAAGTVTSPPVTVAVAPYLPGVFTLDQNGSGPGTIIRAHDLTRICPAGRHDCSANPAIPGDIVSIYMTGLGAVTGPAASGEAPQLPFLTVAPLAVTIGGTQAQVLFAGLAWAPAGLYQVDVIVPANLSAGDSVPLSVNIGGTTSNQVTIAIGTASAQPVLPQGKGPLAEAVTAIGVDPVHRYTVYAGTQSSGVYRSPDAGQTWTAAGNGLPPAPVSVLVVDPSNPDVVYAGIHQSGANDGAYKSTDGGASWTPIRNGLTRGIGALVIDPNNSSTLYANTLGAGVFRSIDGGASWATASSGVFSGGSALAIDPASTIYAGSSQGVYKSTDGAATWSLYKVGAAGANVSALVIDPLNLLTLYAGASSDGVFESTDGGVTWSPGGLASASVTALAIDPLQPSTLYAGTSNSGVLKTTDGGATWNTTSIAGGSVNALTVDPENPAVLYAGTSSGFSASLDGGTSWSLTTSAFTNTYVTALAIDPVNTATLYVGAQGRGVLKSMDGGTTWTRPNNALLGAVISTLAIDPLNPATVYAGTGAGVFKSADGGQNWTPMNSGLTGVPAIFVPGSFLLVQTLAIDPRNSATIYAGMANATNPAFKSTDGGANWTGLGGITLVAAVALAIDPLNTANIYAGGPSGGGQPNAFLSKSTTGGASWTALDSTPQPLAAILIDPQNTSTVYVQTSLGITLKSTNAGGSFAYIGNGTPPIAAMAIDPVNTSTLYTGKQDGVIYKSTSGGAGWALANSGLPASANVNNLAVDPRNPSTIYAGTSNQGIFRSTDGGASWQPTGLN